jgi:hypothetical protein
MRTKKRTSGMRAARVFEMEMKKNHAVASNNGGYVVNATTAAMERMELYCAAHPRGPSAVRRPQLLVRGELWIAFIGPNLEEGIVGIGPTVEAALRAFDSQYLAALRPPAPPIKNRRAFRNPRLRRA